MSAASESSQRNRARRISYFMLFRLAMLAAFTALAGILFYSEPERFNRTYVQFVWGAIVVGYATTILFARILPRTRDLSRFAAFQTATDILLSAAVVQMSGGVDSGFATLYLIAVLGAATMGGPRLTWAAAGACMAIYLTMSSLEYFAIVTPLASSQFQALPPGELWPTVARTTAGLIGVTVLSSYLNLQLATSVSQVGKLRALNENIVRSLSSGLLTTDLEGRVLYFNPTGRAILELDDAQIGRDVEAALPGVNDLPLPGDTGSDGRFEIEVKTPSGRALHVGLSRSSLIDADGQRVGYVINFQDVSRLHDLAQQVRRNERLAAVGGLAASVAHEIRNPLAAISGSAELLGALELADDDARLLKIIRNESARLSALVADLLAFTRPRPPERVPVDFATATHTVCEAFRADPSSSGIEVRHRPQPHVEAMVDPSQLTQVLWNLMRNSAEAMAKGASDRRIDVRVRVEGSRAFIDVEDNGRGIPAGKLENVFDPFFTTKEHGTGFGLAIVHRVVEDNGGTITVESTERGSTFTLSFPLYLAAPEPEDSGVLEL